MTDFTTAADLYDEHGEALASCDTQFREFGGRTRFQGEIVTIRCHEDNAILKEVIREPGAGKVIVVDADGSVHCAMLGDRMADVAHSNGWEGLMINGAVPDAVLIGQLDIGVKALARTRAGVTSTVPVSETCPSPSAESSSRPEEHLSATKTDSSFSHGPEGAVSIPISRPAAAGWQAMGASDVATSPMSPVLPPFAPLPCSRAWTSRGAAWVLLTKSSVRAGALAT